MLDWEASQEGREAMEYEISTVAQGQVNCCSGKGPRQFIQSPVRRVRDCAQGAQEKRPKSSVRKDLHLVVFCDKQLAARARCGGFK